MTKLEQILRNPPMIKIIEYDAVDRIKEAGVLVPTFEPDYPAWIGQIKALIPKERKNTLNIQLEGPEDCSSWGDGRNCTIRQTLKNFNKEVK